PACSAVPRLPLSGAMSRCRRRRRASASARGSGCRVVLSRPWAAPITDVVITVGWMHASPRGWWQVAVPDRGRGLAAALPAHGGARRAGHDRGEVGGGEAQVLAQERARDLAGGGLLTQPRFADPQPLRGFGGGV